MLGGETLQPGRVGAVGVTGQLHRPAHGQRHEQVEDGGVEAGGPVIARTGPTVPVAVVGAGLGRLVAFLSW
ncbi:hypothetical protein [Streptosporangium roseum]|uniref:hypothetical protein n=1 Tax=Streptosporangium roseum TaxID=2001 RepID=UPI0001A3E535|nr:hypothetical protein [Streptosporangium roseum]